MGNDMRRNRMIRWTWRVSIASVWLARLVCGQTTPLTGTHTDIPRWCGKPYEIGEPNYDPAGMLFPPPPQASPLLSLRIVPRYSIYVDSETHGEFILDAEQSLHHGQPFMGTEQTVFDIEIKDESSGIVLVTDKVALNTTGNVLGFNFSSMASRLQPRSILLTAKTHPGNEEFKAATDLYYLPAKTTGSMVKIDNLHGGILFANKLSNFAFEPLLPFGFYTSCSGFLTSFANASVYSGYGFTGINPVCAYTDGNLTDMFDWLDKLNTPFQYDMRGSYYNLTSVEEQVPLVKDCSSLLSWYTADEPDGWQYAFNSTTAAYAYLKEVDPYHPTALVLNCQNYYFDEYSKGTDIIMEDAYPIGINATFSKWGTPVNATYGDCGCDNCIGALRDVSDRLDDLARYQTWLGRPQKPLWTVNQAFSGDYWSRDPTVDEAWAMNLLGFNHNAKGVMNWLFPASQVLNDGHSAMAEVFTRTPIRDFILGGRPSAAKVESRPLLDVAFWMQNGRAMVSLVNQDYTNDSSTVSIDLPVSVFSIESQPWGSLTWTTSGGKLLVHGLSGMKTSVVVLKVGQDYKGQTAMS